MSNDAALADMYKLKLELDGFTVHVAPPGTNAVEQAQQHQPDLIFVDIDRPTAECLRVVQQLRTDRDAGRIPVIILSGCGENELADQGLTLRDSDYLVQSNNDR
jgi:two-component system alkaline phosphatase synthesis response regulator PhoP